jgi:hypothetical protein
MTKNYMFLMMSWKRQVLNVAYKIKITIPERIGKIYTMSDRETGIDENVMMAYFKKEQHQCGRRIHC